jgi:hypothetical protein
MRGGRARVHLNRRIAQITRAPAETGLKPGLTIGHQFQKTGKLDIQFSSRDFHGTAENRIDVATRDGGSAELGGRFHTK